MVSKSYLDAVPLRKLPLNKVPFVPNNESLLGILDRFQEGRSHIAIVSRLSAEKAASVKKVAKRSLTQRIRERVGIGDSSDSSDGESDPKGRDKRVPSKGISWADDTTAKDRDDAEDVSKRRSFAARGRGRHKHSGPRDIEKGGLDEQEIETEKEKQKSKFPRASLALEQTMPADAVLTKKDAEDFLQMIDPAINPLGIITLEDVLEGLFFEFVSDRLTNMASSRRTYRRRNI